MSKVYRSWADRRLILAAIVAEHATKPLTEFNLSDAEDVFYRARARDCIAAMAKKTSVFKAYYDLPVSRPFHYILGLTGLIVVFAVIAAAYLLMRNHGSSSDYPLLAACGTIAVAATASCVAAWIAHRNAVRQNTTNIIFARFSQTAFTDAMHRFHGAFGYLPSEKISRDLLKRQRDKGEDGSRAADAANYLLNYYEMIACGVMRGDLDADIIRDNIRGVIIYYYDKCEPYILECNKMNRKFFANLMRVRTHYREP